MKKLSFVILILAGMAIWGSQATAHSMDITAHFTSAGIGAAQSSEHEDADPFKGWATMYLYNDTVSDYFTGIHFSIFSVPGGSAIDHVFFIDQDLLNNPPTTYPPESPLGIASYTITPPTSTTGAQMLIYFDTPLAPGEDAWVKVYTDNRQDKGRFGVSYYPVPEPATLALLGIGMAFFAARRRK